MPHTPHIVARRSAVCHAIARHAGPQTDWKVENDGEFSHITSKQMRDRLEQTDYSIGLTFEEDAENIGVRSIELPEEMRGQGIGTQLYLQALQYAKDNGLGFKSDLAPTPDAIKVYARLAQSGIPITQQHVESEGGRVLQFSIPAEALQEVEINMREEE